MANLTSFIKKYGNTSFSEMPFCDVDNIVLCNAFYMPYEKTVSDSFDDIPTPYTYASERLFALRGNKHKNVGLVLLKNISEQMMLMTKYKRYKEMKLIACTNVFEKNPDVQFNAGTFLLPNGEIVVIFRGTDDSLRGWKEDFDILTRPSIPSQKLACEYLRKVYDKYKSDIIVCGHSKGGYVALYASIYCDNEVRNHIKLVYNNDGPGFKDYSFLESDGYKDLLPKYKHFVPQSSFIGMLLYHDDDYTVIKSDKIGGPLEHDLSTWQVDDTRLKKAAELTDLGKINDMMMYNLIVDLTEDELYALDEALSANINGTGQIGLLDIKDNPVEALRGAVTANKQIPKKTQDTVKGIFDGFDKKIPEIVRSVRNGGFKSVRERFLETAKQKADMK